MDIDLSGLAEVFSNLTKNPTTAWAVVIIIIFTSGKIGNGFGTAFRDIPKYTVASRVLRKFSCSLQQNEVSQR